MDLFTAALLLAFAVFPLSYLTLSGWMLFRRVWWFTYIAYFVVFGSFGGWCLVVVASAAKESGVLVTLGFEAFLLTCGMAACLWSALVLQRREKKDRLAARRGHAAEIDISGSSELGATRLFA